MQAIIQGQRYDTDKAIKIGEANNIARGADSVRDFAYWEAALYRTPRAGRYFLAGRGGPMSVFARRVDQSTWSGSSGIRPLSADEAREWAEEYLTAEQIEAAFPAADA